MVILIGDYRYQFTFSSFSEPTGFGSQSSLGGSQDAQNNGQQQQLSTAGLHQSSSCSSLYSLASHPPDQENIQPGQKRLLYASVGKPYS
jgi:hypothetical protein